MNAAIKKPRPRRIAADEAHSWARNLRLKNPYAKLVLSMLTIYVNGDGCCFVGSSTLAEDCELALETVRKRLSWLETIGAITRFPQWLDENGKRNSNGRGKRTTDEIRLMIDSDPEKIEARACGGDPVDPQVSPPPDGGLNEAEESPAPALGVCQPPSCVGGLDSSEPEPEQVNTPLTPLAGGDLQNEWFSKFEGVWQEPIIRQSLARQVAAALTDDERASALKAAAGYVAWRRSQNKPPNVIGAHTFLRERDAWPGFAKFAPPEPIPPAPPAAPTFLERVSDEFKAVELLASIAKVPVKITSDPATGFEGISFLGIPPAGARNLAALLSFDTEGEINKCGWAIVQKDSDKFTAWCQRIKEWLGLWPEPQRFWLNGDEIVATHKEAERGRSGLPKCKDGLLVPFDGFPPSKGVATFESTKETDEKEFVKH